MGWGSSAPGHTLPDMPLMHYPWAWSAGLCWPSLSAQVLSYWDQQQIHICLVSVLSAPLPAPHSFPSSVPPGALSPHTQPPSKSLLALPLPLTCVCFSSCFLEEKNDTWLVGGRGELEVVPLWTWRRFQPIKATRRQRSDVQRDGVTQQGLLHPLTWFSKAQIHPSENVLLLNEVLVVWRALVHPAPLAACSENQENFIDGYKGP